MIKTVNREKETMENNAQNIVDDFSLDYLEGVSEDGLSRQEVPGGKREGRTEVLANLEDFDDEAIIPGITVTPQAEAEDGSVSAEDEAGKEPDFIENADVRLSDLISKFLADSVRPVIIICDDKVEYINQTVRDVLNMSDDEMLGHNFLDFVKRDDWNLLAENIGVMLTDAKKVSIHLQAKNGNVVETSMEAMYIPDDNHFAFILIGSKVLQDTEVKKIQIVGNAAGLYDPLTGLPSFYLFEDRVRVAVNREAYKDVAVQKNMIAVAAVSIDNIFSLQQLGMEEYVLKKLASKLVFSLKKSYTVARGIKSQFWILMSDLQDVSDLDVELHKIKSILDEGVEDNLARHEIHSSIGVSVFPVIARSGKKLLDQAIAAIKTAQNNGGGVTFYSDDNTAGN